MPESGGQESIGSTVAGEFLQEQNKEGSVNNKSRGEGLSRANLVIVMNRRARDNAVYLGAPSGLILFARWNFQTFIHLSTEYDSLRHNSSAANTPARVL